jgi:hypothetical protein
MEEHRPSKRFRGYRPPGPPWEIRKQQLGIAIFAVFIVAISFILTRALLIGEIPVPRKHSNEIVYWSANPGRFIRLFAVWTIADLVCGLGMKILAKRVRELRAS